MQLRDEDALRDNARRKAAEQAMAPQPAAEASQNTSSGVGSAVAAGGEACKWARFCEAVPATSTARLPEPEPVVEVRPGLKGVPPRAQSGWARFCETTPTPVATASAQPTGMAPMAEPEDAVEACAAGGHAPARWTWFRETLPAAVPAASEKASVSWARVGQASAAASSWAPCSKLASEDAAASDATRKRTSNSFAHSGYRGEVVDNSKRLCALPARIAGESGEAHASAPASIAELGTHVVMPGDAEIPSAKLATPCRGRPREGGDVVEWTGAAVPAGTYKVATRWARFVGD